MSDDRNIQVVPDLYQYHALSEGRYIRLLRLLPGPGPLRGSLYEHDVGVDTEYQALSYVWGDSAFSDVLICDGKKLPLRHNLALGLAALRSETPVIVWADGVCINQKDDDERGRQVALMEDVYMCAASVFVWLGEDDLEEAQECFALIEHTVKVSTKLLTTHRHVNDIPRSAIEQLLCLEPEKWQTVERLVRRAWFTRLWVLQEVGLARHAVVACGGARMAFCDLVEMALFMVWRTDLAPIVGSVRSGLTWEAFESLWASYGNVHTWRLKHPLSRALSEEQDPYHSLIDILSHSRVYGATDRRDHVYASLGHPKSKASHVMEPDYRSSVEDVYLDTAARILEGEKYGWGALTCVDHLDNSLGKPGPSWVARWDQFWRVCWLGYAQNWYRTGGDAPEAFRQNVIVNRTSRSLTVQCIVIDIVAETSEAFIVDTENRDARRPSIVSNDAFALLRHESNSPYGPDYSEQELAYSLAVAAGRAADDGPAEDDLDRHRLVLKAFQITASNAREVTAAGAEQPSETGQERCRSEVDNVLAFDVATYTTNMQRALTNRRVFRTKSGYYGIGHRELKVGDICIAIGGANVPFLLRAAHHVDKNESCQEMASTFHLVGECYVQGIMRGELFQGAKSWTVSVMHQKSLSII